MVVVHSQILVKSFIQIDSEHSLYCPYFLNKWVIAAAVFRYCYDNTSMSLFELDILKSKSIQIKECMSFFHNSFPGFSFTFNPFLVIQLIKLCFMSCTFIYLYISSIRNETLTFQNLQERYSFIPFILLPLPYLCVKTFSSGGLSTSQLPVHLVLV